MDIDDKELETLQKSKVLLDQLLSSPKTKRNVERAVKALHPETVISDDFDEPLREEISSIGKKLDKFLDDQATRVADSELDKALDKLRTDGGYSDEGLDKIKTLMVERKIADPFAAAAYFDKLNPPPEPQKPTSFNGLSWGIGQKTEDEDLKLLFDDEDAWMEKQATAHFNERKE